MVTSSCCRRKHTASRNIIAAQYLRPTNHQTRQWWKPVWHKQPPNQEALPTSTQKGSIEWTTCFGTCRAAGLGRALKMSANPPKQARQQNLTQSELASLVDPYEQYRRAIESLGESPRGSQAKQRAWANIAVLGIVRTPAEVRKKWCDVKSTAKARVTLKYCPVAANMTSPGALSVMQATSSAQNLPRQCM
ncbi:hypothetical protein HPB52_017307 [Rhipicephalus sanguineus]|uniref:Regulatory protein zeste n=1 Tax=Rhipicephalus sanguineus TaxID=34632 RepID=A0A9D4QCQ1_RHISA|nr:hypothetical protein HPB52_017307 [Rhipicephalus sanguineus]